MKFTITRLCGGKALMASPADTMDIDLDKAAEILSQDGFVKKRNEEGLMLILDWNGMEVTLYTQGKVMFYPLSEKELAIGYATKMLEMIKEKG